MRHLRGGMLYRQAPSAILTKFSVVDRFLLKSPFS